MDARTRDVLPHNGLNICGPSVLVAMPRLRAYNGFIQAVHWRLLERLDVARPKVILRGWTCRVSSLRVSDLVELVE